MEAHGNISIRDVGAKDEEVNLSYTINDVGSEEAAKTLKEKLDKLIKEEGGVTTLDQYITA